MGDNEPVKDLQKLLEENLKANPRLDSKLAREQEERLLPEVEEILRVAPTLNEFSRDSGERRALGLDRPSSSSDRTLEHRAHAIGQCCPDRPSV